MRGAGVLATAMGVLVVMFLALLTYRATAPLLDSTRDLPDSGQEQMLRDMGVLGTEPDR